MKRVEFLGKQFPYVIDDTCISQIKDDGKIYRARGLVNSPPPPSEFPPISNPPPPPVNWSMVNPPPSDSSWFHYISFITW